MNIDKPLMVKLNDEKNVLKEKIYFSNVVYTISKTKVKKLEVDLKLAKKEMNQNYKTWKNERLTLKKLDAKIKSLPSRLRNWAKNNPGKALDTVMKTKN